MRVNDLLENESRIDQERHKLKQLEAEIDAATQAGEIYKPNYEGIKNQVDRGLERLSEVEIGEKFTHGQGSKWYDIDEALGHLGYVHSARDVLAMKNKLARVKTQAGKDTPFYKALVTFYNEWRPIAEKLVALKEKIVTAAMKRDVKKREKEVVQAKKRVSSASLIKVLEEHMDDYIERAKEMKKETIDYLAGKLKAVDWDLDKLFEQPDYRKHGRHQHRELANNRGNYLQLFDVESQAGSYDRDPNKHTKLKRSPKKEKIAIQQAAEGAKASYLEWVEKMIDKIGKPVVKAKTSGNPWTGSILEVETDDGEKQMWHTKMILNFSKYGTMFNQFPSLRKS